MAQPPTYKSSDSDYSPMMLTMAHGTSRGCSCDCCGEGHGRGPMGPLPERPLGPEQPPVAAEAMGRRRELIVKTLLPQAKALAASMARANEDGTVGFGELELLGALQRWVLQLQIEADDLRLGLTPPDLDAKKP
jgi:hypothetical protein